jgi:flagellar motor switch protein FliN
VTDTMISRAAVNAGIEAAALVLAQKLGLGDQARIGTEWPIGEGDAVLVMVFADDPASSMILGVNDEVAERLLSNASLLNSTFAEAVAALNAATGSTLQAGPVEQGEMPEPSSIVEILDSGELTAVAGVTLSSAETEAEPAEPEHEAYEPAPLNMSAALGISSAAMSSLSVLHDVELVLTAELGRTTMAVRDLLGLVPGMVVEIDRAAGSPIDLLVNGRRIAAGEVVVIDEEFGIRITEIASSGEHAQ